MQVRRLFVPALLFGASLVAISCSDESPLAPQTAPPVAQNGLLGSVLNAAGNTVQSLSLVECSALPARTVTKVIGPSGGTINVGPHTFTVPRGALNRNVAITATIVSENVNRVHFEPAGLRFNRPATLEMSYANCSALARLLPKRIAYVSGDLTVLFNYLNSVDVFRAAEVSGEVDHFSDYVLAW